jgi:hypothetical protein
MNFFFNNEKEKTKEKGKQIQKQLQKGKQIQKQLQKGKQIQKQLQKGKQIQKQLQKEKQLQQRLKKEKQLQQRLKKKIEKIEIVDQHNHQQQLEFLPMDFNIYFQNKDEMKETFKNLLLEIQKSPTFYSDINERINIYDKKITPFLRKFVKQEKPFKYLQTQQQIEIRDTIFDVFSTLTFINSVHNIIKDIYIQENSFIETYYKQIEKILYGQKKNKKYIIYDLVNLKNYNNKIISQKSRYDILRNNKKMKLLHFHSDKNILFMIIMSLLSTFIFLSRSSDREKYINDFNDLNIESVFENLYFIHAGKYLESFSDGRVEEKEELRTKLVKIRDLNKQYRKIFEEENQLYQIYLNNRLP